MDDASELQAAILEVLYKSTANSPFSFYETESIVNAATEKLEDEYDDSDIKYALRRLDEEYLVDHERAIGGRGTITLTPNGVDEYNKRNTSFLKTENWVAVLERLQELDRESGGRYLDGENLRDMLDMDNVSIDRNIWYLEKKGLIDVKRTHGDPPYGFLRINKMGRQTLKNHQQSIEKAVNRQNNMENTTYDVFISHASEDKEEYVRPLAQLLDKKGLSVWYDEFELQIGDSLRNSIDQGLSAARYGIIVLSSHYFQKDWTQYELNGLVARDISDENVILPVWYRITQEDILNNSPTLADKYGLRTDGSQIEDDADQLIDVINN